MPSIRSSLFRFVLRQRHLLNGKKRMEHFDRNSSVEEFRNEVNKAHKLFGRLPKNIELNSFAIDELKCEWLKFRGTKNDKVILYFHGGGYISGNCESHRTHVSKVVKATGIGALVFEYRVAPENPYPAALEDSLKAYQYLQDQGIKPSNILFMGDSAGGGLCLAALNALKDKNLALPSAAVVLSPWTDLKCTGDSYIRNLEVEPFAPKECWIVFGEYYVQDNDYFDPWISPLYGDLKGLPPVKIYAGGHEVMMDDSVRYYEKAKKAGVEAELTIGEKLFHCYPICAPIFPEATKALNEIAEFIKDKLDN